MTRDEEKALIARCKSDPAAFGRVYDELFDRIFKFVLYRVADVPLAEDLTSQVFINALKGLSGYRWKGISISAWLYRIAINEINGHYRRSRRMSPIDIAGVADSLEDNSTRPDKELADAEAHLAEKERFLMLHRCMSELKKEEQTLLVLRYYEKKPYGEISDILGKKESALRMRVKRALAKLRDRMAEKEAENEAYGRSLIRHGTAGSNGRGIPDKAAAEPA